MGYAVLLQEAVQLGVASVQVHLCHQVLHMVNQGGIRPALDHQALRRIVRVVDVEMRGAPHGDVRIAALRHPDAFSRSPFHASVRAGVDDRIGSPDVLEVVVAGQELMCRGAGRVVEYLAHLSVATCAVASALGLDDHDHVPELHSGYQYAIVQDHCFSGRLSPCGLHILLGLLRQRAEVAEVLVHVHGMEDSSVGRYRLDSGPTEFRQGLPAEYRVDELLSVLRGIDIVALFLQALHQVGDALEAVQSGRVPNIGFHSVARVVVEEDRHPLLRVGLPFKRDMVGDAFGQPVHPFRNGDASAVPILLYVRGHHIRIDYPLEFRERYVPGYVARETY